MLMCMDHIQSATLFCKTWKFQEGKSEFSKCQCLQILIDTNNDEDTDTSGDADSVVRIKEDTRKAVALYMMWFFELKNINCEQIIIDWIRYTEHERGLKNHKRFFLPFINPHACGNKDDIIEASTLYLEQPNSNLICRSALRHLLDIGRSTWNRCQKAVRNNTLPAHGLSKRQSNKSKRYDDTVANDLMEFLKGLEDLLEPRSTRVIRLATGNGLCDGADGVTYLPNYFLRRGMYNRFYTERDWTLKYLE